MAEKKITKKKPVAKKTKVATLNKSVATKVKVAEKKKRKTPAVLKPFAAMGRYFKGSWDELRQVRWPNRRATWVLTIAVLIFTGFFTLLIVALDTGFEYILNRILL